MTIPSRNHRARPGFTLVEMLVSVAIVSLMMVLFAEVFSLSSQSVGTQKGIGRNDQRTRVILNVLRSDLDNRTFESLVPFAPGETDPPAPTTSDELLRVFDDRRGFFYISENDPASDLDDVLQFTIQVDGSTPLYGASAAIPGVADGDEPDQDDGVPGDGASTSTYAVVSYFLRYGVLYRRVLLLRQPLDNTFDPDPSQPVPAGTEFWATFDNSAHHDGASIVWHGVNPTENWIDNGNAAGLTLGDPHVRFGHNFDDGLPREYDSGGNYFGRFTHEETSHANFDWPLLNVKQFSTTPPANLNARGVISEFANGPRRGEDVLMQNCHSFDVKVFDESAGAFVDLGTGAGDYAAAARYNAAYGPNNATKNVFDTWHPGITVAGSSEPPFRPAGTLNGAGSTDDSNLRPVRAIQITLRFFDVNSGQMRQVTLQHGMTDRPN